MPPGIDLLAAVGEVRVLAVVLRAAAGEVLRHARDALGPEALALEAADVGGDHLRGELGVLAEGAGRRAPTAARWRGRPRGGGRRGSRRRGTPAGRCRRTRSTSPGSRGRRQPERLGPLGEVPPGPTRRRVGAEPVPRVGRDGDGDRQPRLLGQPLQPVVPLGEQPRLWRPVDVDVGHEAIADEIRRRRAHERPELLDQLALRPDPERPGGTSSRPSPRASSGRAGRRPAPRPGAADPRTGRACRCDCDRETRSPSSCRSATVARARELRHR